MDLRLFGNNSRGFSFEIERVCRDLGSPVNCNVSFDNSNTPLTFGRFGPGEFEPSADIAGIGIFVALLVQASLIYLGAVFSAFSDPRNRLSEAVYTTLLSISDVLLITTFAYILNFWSIGKCVMSTYHYYVALDSVLIACSAILAILITSRRRTTPAGILRWLGTFVILILLGIFIGYQMFKKWDTQFPEWNPPLSRARNDSTLLLPASCFLDPDLENRESPYAPYNPNITDLRLDRIGRSVKVKQLPEIWFYAIIALVFLIGPFVRRYCHFNDPEFTYQESMILKRKRRWPGLLLLGACLASFMYSAWHIDQLRRWAKTSGWMKDNSEDEWLTIGQLLPLFALLLVVTSWLERDNSEKKLQEFMRQMRQISRRGHGGV